MKVTFMSKLQSNLQTRPDSATRVATLYGWFRNETLVGKSRQLDKMPAHEALNLARRYVDLTSDLDLSPGISGSASTPDRLSFDAWR